MKNKPADYVWSFIFGGLLCMAAQFVFQLLLNAGIEFSLAITLMLAIMALISGILTLLGQYQKAELLAGFGAMLPFTGFSAAIIEFTAAALDEGKSFGRACFQGLKSGLIIFGIGLPFAFLAALCQSFFK
jgi:hypothetical protein